MNRRVRHSVAGIALWVGLLLLACGLAGDHGLAELWRPVP